MPETTYLGNEGSMGQEERMEEGAMEEAVERNAMPLFQPIITNVQPETGILATADVRLGDICTVRNVKIKENDYGKEVVMPRTKVSYNGAYKDACFFKSRELREQFDQSVLRAYEQLMDLEYGMEDDMDMELEEVAGPEM
ncbi:MAG: SpoVG family protein [Clostridia bacterium]|nr:SpoVG family protein [Clostridia bacterium]